MSSSLSFASSTNNRLILYDCGGTSNIRTSWTVENFGKWFHDCSRYRVNEQCKYFSIDHPTCRRGTELAAKIVEKFIRIQQKAYFPKEKEEILRAKEKIAMEREIIARGKAVYKYALFGSWILFVIIGGSLFLGDFHSN